MLKESDFILCKKEYFVSYARKDLEFEIYNRKSVRNVNWERKTYISVRGMKMFSIFDQRNPNFLKYTDCELFFSIRKTKLRQ